MSRAAISVERVEFNPDKNSVAIYERQDRSPSGMSTTYTIYGQFYRENQIGRIAKEGRPKGLRPGMAEINLWRYLQVISLRLMKPWFITTESIAIPIVAKKRGKMLKIRVFKR